MLFYVVFAFALWLKKPPLVTVSIALILISTGSLLRHSGGPAIVTFCDPVVLEFLYGMLLFYGYRRGIRIALPWAWGAVGIGLSVMLLVSPGHWLLPRFLIWGLPALVVVAGAVSLEDQVRGMIPRWALKVGDSSYSIYLSHLFVLPVVGIVLLHLHVVGAGSIAPAIVLSVLIAIGAGEVTYRFLELPIVHFFRGRRAVVAGNAGAV
jgi:exopolysaccharide production protein ExoZ